MSEAEAQIVELLRRHPRGLRKEEVCRCLRGRSLSAVVEALESLRGQRVVELGSARKWRLLNPEAPPVLTQGPTGPQAGHRAGTDPEPRRPPRATRWRTFRDLCWYYAQCVRLAERPNLVTDLDREGSEYLDIGRPIDWQAVAAGRPVHLPLDAATHEFVRHLKRGRRGNRLFLGAPVDVKNVRDKDKKKPRRIVSPVFVVQVEYKVVRDEVVLEPELVVDVNHGWLDRSLGPRNPELQQEFLESVGLRDDDLREQPDGEATPQSAPQVSNLAVLHRQLQRTRGDRWREGGGPERPCTDPPLHDVDRDGIYNRVILIAEPRMKYSRGLFAELKYLAKGARDEDIERSAVPLLFDPDAPGGKSPYATPLPTPRGTGEPFVTEYQLLNDDQRAAVARGLAAPLTVVTGPPGTGKSVVVGHVMANLALAKRPVLFASRNHQALEAVEPRLNALVDPDAIVIRPTRPFGQSASDQGSWIRLMTDLLSRPQKPGAAETFQRTLETLRALVTSLRNLEKAVLDQLRLGEKLAELNGRIYQTLIVFHRNVEERVRSLPNLPSAAAYRRVAEALAPPAAHAGVLRRLWKRATGFAMRRFWMWRARRLDASGRAEYGEPAKAWSIPSAGGTEGHAEAMRRWADIATAVDLATRCKELEERIRGSRDMNELKDALQRTHEQVRALTQESLAAFVDQAGGALSSEEIEKFASIRGALKLGGDTANPDRQSRELTAALRDSFSSIVRHFPAWAVSNLSARSALPLSPGVFDLLVIDEASQCDIASVVPLLFRARRLMVVGDPMQLPPVFKLNRQSDRQIRSRLHLDDDIKWGRYLHSANSFYDLASSSPRIDRERDLILLSGHYRCHGAIAAYCNASFYRKSLRVRTNEDGLNSPSRNGAAWKGCAWSHVPGDTRAAAQGSYSPAQVESAIAELRRLAADRFRGSVGVVTPFRAQANRISDRAKEEIDRDQLERWNFLVDTADGFQGDERDVMLFSLVGSHDMPEGSLWFYRSNRNRFNVAASRAKALLHILGDKDWARTCGISYIRDLLEACERERTRPRRHELIGPVWEPKLADALRAAGLDFEQQYPACGYYLDFAILSDGVRIDVEVDGETYHRDEITNQLRCEDVYRDWLLTAAGWKVQRFWVYQLRDSMEACVERIREHLEPK